MAGGRGPHGRPPDGAAWPGGGGRMASFFRQPMHRRTRKAGVRWVLGGRTMQDLRSTLGRRSRAGDQGPSGAATGHTSPCANISPRWAIVRGARAAGPTGGGTRAAGPAAAEGAGGIGNLCIHGLVRPTPLGIRGWRTVQHLGSTLDRSQRGRDHGPKGRLIGRTSPCSHILPRRRPEAGLAGPPGGAGGPGHRTFRGGVSRGRGRALRDQG